MRYAAVTGVMAVCLGFAFISAASGQTANAAPPDVVSSTAGELRVQKLTTLEFPWAMALLPDGRLLITEKPGRLRVWADGKLSDPITGVPKVVYRDSGVEQGGLMDVAIDPNFAQNKFVYLSFSEAAEQQSPQIAETDDFRLLPLDMSDNIIRGGAVARGRLDGNELRDVKVIWRQEPKTVGRGHFGNRLAFAPDGTLYITSGERKRFEPAQDLSTNLGKVVRINPDGSIPKDNPFVGKEGARPDIWSYGLRNALSIAFNPADKRLWVVEMGPLGGDELNLIKRGANYGWPLVSDGDHYVREGVSNATITSIPGHATDKRFEAPVRSWTPVISPSGAHFYSGAMFPQWRGNLLFGGLSSKCLVRLVLDGERVAVEERIDMGRRIRDVTEAPDGAILLIVDDSKGDLLRLTPSGDSSR
jgi:glucose/arabinose dehydrogenase